MSDVLPFTRRSQPVWACFDVQQVIDDSLASLAPRLRDRRIQVDVDVLPGTSWIADRELVRQALVQMLANATDAMPGGGELDITVWAGPSGLELEVADSGPGLNDGAARDSRESHGDSGQAGGARWGLVRRIAEAHGGRVLAANCPQGGAAFTLVLPRPVMRAAA